MRQAGPARCCLASATPVSFPEAKIERRDLPLVVRRLLVRRRVAASGKPVSRHISAALPRRLAQDGDPAGQGPRHRPDAVESLARILGLPALASGAEVGSSWLPVETALGVALPDDPDDYKRFVD